MLTWFSNCSIVEQVAIVSVIVFLTVILTEVVDCSWIFCQLNARVITYIYGYEDHNGPIVWKKTFPESKGKQQSPIDILTSSVVCVPSETQTPLKFSSGYYSMPTTVVACNDGHSLIVNAWFPTSRHPKICGGSLQETYRFHSIRFRWGPSDEEGSEHAIDNIRFAMEIQAMHVKSDRFYCDITEAAGNNAVMVISYLFQITPIDNPYLEPILCVLREVQEPNTQFPMDPFPICWLTPPFTSKYFTYLGSLTFPPCSENVEWMVLSEPLSISSRQLNRFRKLCSCDGQMICNTRPVQELNNRCVYFYD